MNRCIFFSSSTLVYASSHAAFYPCLHAYITYNHSGSVKNEFSSKLAYLQCYIACHTITAYPSTHVEDVG